MQRMQAWGGASHTFLQSMLHRDALALYNFSCLELQANRQRDGSRYAYNSCTSRKLIHLATWDWPTIFDLSLYTGDIALFMTGCLQSSTGTSVKHNNKNGRQTKPHPPLTWVSEDSLRSIESDADLQFLIYNFHKEKFSKISSASIHTIHSVKVRQSEMITYFLIWFSIFLVTYSHNYLFSYY